jgi:hypothetical protein
VLKRFLIVAFLLTGNACSALLAQQLPVDPDLPSVLADVPSVPGVASRLRGFNTGATLTSVHDSAAGWYTLATPAIAYNFSWRYSMDMSMPVYLYRLAETDTSPASVLPQPGQPAPPVQSSTTQLTAHTFDPGDIFLATHANFAGRHIGETLTLSMTLPSGDTSDGLSTGRVTFDLDSHSALWLPGSGLLMDLGWGDSTSLFNRLVTRDYTSLGYLAHFQLGAMVALPRRSSFQAVAYEQLPIGDSKVYTTLPRPGAPTPPGASSPPEVVSGRSVSEDNGFTSTLYIPLTRHLTLQGYYNRSLRLKTDTVGMGISFVARGPEARKPQSSYYEQLLKK